MLNSRVLLTNMRLKNVIFSADSMEVDEEHTIKIEVLEQPSAVEDEDAQGESITDLQNYLQRFNKEIQTGQNDAAPNNGSQCLIS